MFEITQKRMGSLRRFHFKSSRAPDGERTSARYDNDFVRFNYRSDECISTSGNQNLCDKLQSCIQKLPTTLLNNFNECVSQVYPHGKLGKCNDQENLFGTNKQLKQYFHCFINKLPQKSSLSPEEQRQFDHPYKRCMLKVGHECLDNQ
ncbi:spider silk-constituting element SpiCE-NMa4 [Trichonephila clavata]|uniref:Spider silk-constituting element SpiCE-NMa4 n=1 Tax=Trichonephila clavata TaxID=2740835 RepID=A0A8X6H2B3_TRICU|nr:spider silk-constituting element SpiCE-NMa4 [Trichonephila clavata]